jgi:hypothetical protein
MYSSHSWYSAQAFPQVWLEKRLCIVLMAVLRLRLESATVHQERYLILMVEWVDALRQSILALKLATAYQTYPAMTAS